MPFLNSESKKVKEAVKNYWGERLSDENISLYTNFIYGKINKYKQYIDNHFIARLKTPLEFEARLTELYFIEALLNQGLSITHLHDFGLDIHINNINGWGEFVSATNGEEPTALKVLHEDINECYTEPLGEHDDEVLCRLTSVISRKIEKVQCDISKQIISKCEPIILFISSAWLCRPPLRTIEGGISPYVGTVLPIGPPIATLTDNGAGLIAKISPTLKESIKKATGDQNVFIPNRAFLRKESTHISAIVFSYQPIIFPLINFRAPEAFHCGDDFIMVHNPYAENPIPPGFLKCSKEYEVKATDTYFSIKDLCEM